MQEERTILPPRHTRAGGGIGRVSVPAMDALLRAALDAAPTGMIIVDNARLVRLITARAADFLGLRHGVEASGKQLMQLAAESHVLDEPALRILAALFDTPDVPEQRHVLLSLPQPVGARVVRLDVQRLGALGWSVSLVDVSQADGADAFLRRHNAADPATGLAHKRQFMRVLRDRLEAAADAGVTVIRLGLHRPAAPAWEAGEALVRLAASRILSCLRAEDVVGRFVADEFAVLVSQPSGRPALTELAARLTDTLSRPYMIEGRLVTASAQAGLACAPQDGTTAEALVAHAELALAASRADHSGKPRFFEPRLVDRARHRRGLELGLRFALAHGEFVLHYQPQIDLRTRHVRVFEALIRWQSSERGLVPPDEFIPLAEQTGLIADIGAWVLDEACREAAGWPDHIAVAVNASPLQIEQPSFADTVAAALAASGLPPHRLEIEITENLLLQPNPAVNATLLRLREMGVHLVMDDFGTGYASLSQLAKFRFNKIKIDRSLISAPDAVEEHSAIVRAIAALGVSLCVPITAEGVETVEQLDRITENGCIQAQGFYFSRAVPPDAVPALVERLESQRNLQTA
jgi:diguanylate cyclase (GGDEF)-like protein